MTKWYPNTPDSMTRLVLILSLFLPLAGDARASENDGPKPEKAEATAVGLAFSFKLDPRLTRAQYMGDRWVAPTTYMINHDGTSATVEARAHVTDVNGQPLPVRPRWQPADPAMVTVMPDEGIDVTITVHRAGESRLVVTADGVSRDLNVKAVQNKDALLVEIAQVPPAGTPEGQERAKILEGQTERMGYALGVDFGRKLMQHRAEVDADSLMKGLTDALGGKALLTEEELRGALVAYQSQQQAKQPKDRGDGRVDLAEKNRSEGEAFLAENKTKVGVITLDSGLQYRVIAAGDGAKPTVDDRIVCHYRGTSVDGKEFESSYKRQKPAMFALKKVIKGWREALQRMPVGSRWQLFIPADLAYGARGSRTGIGPNQTLVFEIELLSIREGPAATGRRASAGRSLSSAHAQP
jgi:FKBP-type peptidyl-prolyl cis-trans isomerase